jgi:hypothetical protein
MATTHPISEQTAGGGTIQPLVNWRIGISISFSPDLTPRGFGEVHLEDALVEFARYLLASGASLAYGGDHRQAGFTEVLFDLARTYNQEGRPNPTRIANFLAWPLHLNVSTSRKAQLKDCAELHELPPPADLGVDATQFLPPDTVENRYVWTRCLTAMREEMNCHTQARILLGGTVRKNEAGNHYLGKYPGLAEEAYLALRDEKPLFLVGAFGGCTQAVIEAIRGGQPEALTAEYQLQDPGYAALVEHYNQYVGDPAEQINYETLVDFFRLKGVSGLRNGLSDDDNQRLFGTRSVREMISLILQGLVALASAINGAPWQR